MAIAAFIAAFGRKQVSAAGEGLLAALVSWDPETASEADLLVMEQQLDDLSKEVARAKTSADKERGEAENARKKYENYAKVAREIKAELDAKPDDATLQADLQACLDELRAYKPEMEREEQESLEANAWLDELTKILTEKGAAARSRRAELEKTKVELERAERRAEAEKDKAERAARIAGLRGNTDAAKTALDSMKKKITEANEEAEAARLKAKVITGPDTKNDRIADRLAKVDGSPSTSPRSFADQMADLGIA